MSVGEAGSEVTRVAAESNNGAPAPSNHIGRSKR